MDYVLHTDTERTKEWTTKTEIGAIHNIIDDPFNEQRIQMEYTRYTKICRANMS